MLRLTDHRHTVAASYVGYITQAIVNNFAPLLFLTFYGSFGISLQKIGLLVSINFGTQLAVDLLSAKFVDKIGYRAAAVTAHLFCAAGLLLLGILPTRMSSAYSGIVIPSVLYAIGGGLAEVVISPIVESCPIDRKSAAMSMLHSFYSWGSVIVVLVSTMLLRFLGMNSWRYVSMGWAAIPILNALYFLFVPLYTLTEKDEGLSIRSLLGTKVFWLFALLMFCAGASELAVAQWVSAFAESGLKVSKTVGDIAGPCFFAVCMGIARVIHSKLDAKIKLQNYILICAVGCVAGYLVASLVPNAVIALIGCGICGFSVGVMWPGVYSIASRKIPAGGTAMFALLALFGDLGCMAGPSLVGTVSGVFDDNLGRGLLCAAVFPLLMTAALIFLRRALSEPDNSLPLRKP